MSGWVIGCEIDGNATHIIEAEELKWNKGTKTIGDQKVSNKLKGKLYATVTRPFHSINC